MHVRKQRPRKPAPPAPKPVRRVVTRDLTGFSRTLSLPAHVEGFASLSKGEVSNDFRLISGLPQLHPADAPQDALLNSTTRLHVDLRAGLPADQPEPEAAFSRQDEKPQVVQALEAAAFQGRMEEDEDEPSMWEPARAMSSWVAARVIAESASRQLYVSGAPGFVAGSTGATWPAPRTPFSAAAAASPGTAGAYAVGIGSTLGQGLPVGVGPVRLELSLKERFAALSARREEQDKRRLALRRQYINELRNMRLETKEAHASLEALRNLVAHQRAQVHPHRSSAYVTDAEEWADIAHMVASAAAVVRQNAQLRQRLAHVTARVSGNTNEEEAQAVSDAPVRFFADDSGGCVEPAPKRRRQVDADGSYELVAQEPLPADTGMHLAFAVNDSDAPYAVRSRSLPRACLPRMAFASATIVAVGDLVATPYGRAVVVTQSESAPYFTTVRLQWGATAMLTPACIRLLAVAGERCTAPISNDALMFLQPSPVTASNSARRGNTLGLSPSADDILSRAAVPLPPSCSSSAAGAVPHAVRAVIDERHVPLLQHQHQMHASAGDDEAQVYDEDTQNAAGNRAAQRVRPRPGAAVNNTRVCVFRSSFQRFGAPRGTALRIDSRGNGTAGYVVGTMDGMADDMFHFHPPAATVEKVGASVGRYGSIELGAASMATALERGKSAGRSGEGAHMYSPTRRAAMSDTHAAAADGVHRTNTASVATAQNGGTFLAGRHATNSVDQDMTPALAVTGSSADAFGLGSGATASASLSPHGGHHHPMSVQRYRGEVQRLTYQLRTAEESRKEQRKQLTEARIMTSRLLEQLNEMRAQLARVNAEISRRDNDIGELQSKLGRMHERYASDVATRGWAGMNRFGTGAGATRSDDASTTSSVPGTGDDMAAFNALTDMGAMLDDVPMYAPASASRGRGGRRGRGSSIRTRASRTAALRTAAVSGQARTGYEEAEEVGNELAPEVGDSSSSSSSEGEAELEGASRGAEGGINGVRDDMLLPGDDESTGSDVAAGGVEAAADDVAGEAESEALPFEEASQEFGDVRGDAFGSLLSEVESRVQHDQASVAAAGNAMAQMLGAAAAEMELQSSTPTEGLLSPPGSQSARSRGGRAGRGRGSAAVTPSAATKRGSGKAVAAGTGRSTVVGTKRGRDAALLELDAADDAHEGDAASDDVLGSPELALPSASGNVSQQSGVPVSAGRRRQPALSAVNDVGSGSDVASVGSGSTRGASSRPSRRSTAAAAAAAAAAEER